jgi:hypothetical protein
MRVGRATAWGMIGLAGGLLLGVALAAGYQRRHAQGLFSARARRRWAALGQLAVDGTVDSLPLVREYVAWEPHPRLRRRGEALLRQLQSLEA